VRCNTTSRRKACRLARSSLEQSRSSLHRPASPVLSTRRSGQAAALRRLVVLHRHEWGPHDPDRVHRPARVLGIPEAERRRIYEVAIKPYLFWTDALAKHAGLPLNQVIYSYNPLTFLLSLSAHATQIDLACRVQEWATVEWSPPPLYVPIDDCLGRLPPIPRNWRFLLPSASIFRPNGRIRYRSSSCLRPPALGIFDPTEFRLACADVLMIRAVEWSENRSVSIAS